jgi:endonuclease G
MRRLTALIAALVLAPSLAAAGPTACPERFASGQAPALTKESLAQKSRELCYGAFAVLHSGLTRTPLWSAERLTRASVSGARAMERTNNFHVEERLPASERADLSDYVRSGYDRGHMAPSGDMPDAATQEESFTLANMIPQDPDNNRKLWAGIESAVRDLAQREGEAYVVTGPAFAGTSLLSLKGRVIVPTSVYKAVYVPSRGIAGAYVAPNDATGQWKVVSVDALRDLVGIDVFPSLPAALRATAGPLPEPGQRRGGGEATARTAPAGEPRGAGPGFGMGLLKEAAKEVAKEVWRHAR